MNDSFANTYTVIAPHAREIARSHARGVYQIALLAGREAWSGASLQGKAASYASHYARSRDGLLSRLYADERLVVRELRVAHGKRVVEIDLALAYRHDEGPQHPHTCVAHTDCRRSSALGIACGERVQSDAA